MPSDGFKDFVLDQLDRMGPVTCRAMFGGYGLYHRAVFFGIIHKGRLFFKTDARAQVHYRARGMQPFRPTGERTLTSYYEVPLEILEDARDLIAWAHQAAHPPCRQLSLPWEDGA